MSRREAWLSAGLVFVVAVAVRAWAASLIPFPRPEDAAYYVGVARNLVEGRGLVSDAIWSFQTPPLSFPRPAFEVWLPLPSFLMAGSMAVLGTPFAAAQVPTVLVGGLVAVLAWRLGADVGGERGLSVARSRWIALGTGLTAAVSLPLVLASIEPDSTIVFAALALGACLLMARLARDAGDAFDRHHRQQGGGRLRWLIGLGVLLGLAALTRDEAIWLALTWAIVAWGLARGEGLTAGGTDAASGGPDAASGGADARPGSRARAWARLVGVPAVVALLIFAPWAIRDWATFGTPLPGQALGNALSLEGSDIFAWSNPPTLERYLDAGLATLLQLRGTAAVHNLVNVLLLLGVPVSAIGLVALPWTGRGRTLRPLVIFAVIALAVATLVFPVATTWGTFLHAAGAIHVLLIVSASLALDAVIERVRRARDWTRPVAWLGPALTITGAALLSVVILPSEHQSAAATQARYSALPDGLARAGISLDTEPGPVITDFPIWFAESTGHTAIALPAEGPTSVADLAAHFDAHLLIVQADNGGPWPEAAIGGDPRSSCFTPVPLTHLGDDPDPLSGVTVFRIACP